MSIKLEQQLMANRINRINRVVVLDGAEFSQVSTMLQRCGAQSGPQPQRLRHAVGNIIAIFRQLK